jgi:hypothetical protein
VILRLVEKIKKECFGDAFVYGCLVSKHSCGLTHLFLDPFCLVDANLLGDYFAR